MMIKIVSLVTGLGLAPARIPRQSSSEFENERVWGDTDFAKYCIGVPQCTAFLSDQHPVAPAL